MLHMPHSRIFHVPTGANIKFVIKPHPLAYNTVIKLKNLIKRGCHKTPVYAAVLWRRKGVKFPVYQKAIQFKFSLLGGPGGVHYNMSSFWQCGAGRQKSLLAWAKLHTHKPSGSCGEAPPLSYATGKLCSARRYKRLSACVAWGFAKFSSR
jgi:hypothetical protein